MLFDGTAEIVELMRLLMLTDAEFDHGPGQDSCPLRRNLSGLDSCTGKNEVAGKNGRFIAIGVVDGRYPAARGGLVEDVVVHQ